MKGSICIDIDNVVAKTDEVMRSVIRANSRRGVDLRYEDVVCFDYWLCRDSEGRRIDRDEWGLIHEEFTSNHLTRISPFDGIQEHLRLLARKFEIHLATSRLEHGHEATREWLETYSIPHDHLHFVRHGEKHLLDQELVAIIEDDREQAIACFASGIPAYLIAHPWNTVGQHSPIKRIAGWEEITKDLLRSTMWPHDHELHADLPQEPQPGEGDWRNQEGDDRAPHVRGMHDASIGRRAVVAAVFVDPRC